MQKMFKCTTKKANAKTDKKGAPSWSAPLYQLRVSRFTRDNLGLFT